MPRFQTGENMKPLIIVVSFDNDLAAKRVKEARESGRANARAIDAARWDLSPEPDAHGYHFFLSDDERDEAFAAAMVAAGRLPYDGRLEPDTGEPKEPDTGGTEGPAMGAGTDAGPEDTPGFDEPVKEPIAEAPVAPAKPKKHKA
jgi:hypothetical protein